MDLRKTYKSKYNAEPTRLHGWDYGSSAMYFITICTKDRVKYFGEIAQRTNEEANLIETEIGQVAKACWLNIPQYFPVVEVDEFVIMPDHLQAILVINNPEKSTWRLNAFGPQLNNLAAIIRSYKSSVTKYANDNGIEFSWQPKYYDHIIRNQKEYHSIVNYIKANPEKWLSTGGKDDEYVSRITGKH